MRRPALRALMVVVGVSSLLVYLAVGYVLWVGASALWRLRPSAGTVLVYLVVFTLVFALASYRAGTRQLLRDLRALELPADRAPTLYRRVEAYSDAMGIERPRLLIAQMDQPNALALGGGLGPGMVVIDRRLFRLLSRDELAAIVAHELAHIERRDSLIQTLGYSTLRTLSGVVVVLVGPVLLVVTGLARASAWILGRPHAWTRTLPGRVSQAATRAVSLAFFALTLALRAHSRRRELAADDRAATVTGDPLALARALRKIERATRSPWSLLSPLYVQTDEDDLGRLLATHPSTDERVERLKERVERDRGRRIPIAGR